MRPSLKDVAPQVFGVLSTPKEEELVAIASRHGGRDGAELFFIDGMTRAIQRMVKSSAETFPATIYYAFKQSEVQNEGISSTGWATFLQAVIEAGYAVVGTWPLRTEMANRMIASGTNALANSVVLVCRKKETSAEVITRAEFIRALKQELPSAISELQTANIAPADMPQSAIGPGMGVFSRYKAVLEADDGAMSVRTALQLINRELDEYLGGIQGEFDADTRFAISWFEQNGFKAGDYGTANSIATARGISVESVKHAGIVESQAGKVRILGRKDLDNAWEPGDDPHLTIWECCQHLVRLHEQHGIGYETAVMLKKLGSKADAGNAHVVIDSDSVIVQPAIAEKQLAEDQAKTTAGPSPVSTPTLGAATTAGTTAPPTAAPPVEAKPTRFIGSVMISPDRPAHEMRQIVEAIIEQLTTMKGAEVSLRLEIDAEVPDGIDRSKVRTLLENANTLGFLDKLVK